MRDPLAEKVVGIKPSGIRKFFDIVSEMKDAISLGVGEPDFDTPWHIRDEGIYSLEKGKTFYTSNAGLKELRVEIGNYLKRSQNLTYDPLMEMLITVGGSEGIDMALRAMCNPGDEVLIPQPCYVSYVPCTVLAGGVPVIIDLKPENEFRLTAKEIEDAVTEKTKILILPFPNNPTGAVMNKDQLQMWVDYANENDSVILYDAAYEAYISEEEVPHSIYECEGARDCAIEIRSFSKKAGFTGLRLGFTVIPKHLMAGGEELWPLWARRHGTRFNGAPYIVQRAGAQTYTPEARAQIMQQVDYYMENAACIYNGLRDAGYEVSGGLNAPYIWLKAPGGLTSWEFFDLLLEQAHVVSTPGSGFGPHGEHYMRLSAFGSRENTRLAVERIVHMQGNIH